MLNNQQKKILLHLSEETIKAYLEKRPLTIKCPPAEIYKMNKGLFVSLHLDDSLRGCIGYIRPYFRLFDAVKELSLSAAFNDPRFPPLEQEELEHLEIEISILSDLIPVNRHKLDDIRIGRDGLYIDGTYGSGLLLPQVAVKYDWDRTAFLREVCQKAGLPPKSYLSEAYNLYRFSAEIFSNFDEDLSDSQT